MNRYWSFVFVPLLAGLLASCGGGGSTPSTPSGPSGTTTVLPTAGMRVEESDVSVTLTGAWTKSDSSMGWSGGSAMQATTAGATAKITFVGTSIRWIGSRGRNQGLATVSIDGGAPVTVDTFARPADEAHTSVHTFYDLSPGQHTLTLTVTGTHNPQGDGGNVIIVDAFDIQPSFVVSHWQDTNPDLQYTGGWTKSSENFPWSGSGVSNLPELPVTAQETQMAGDKMTVPFRGTGIGWVGYRGPDAGIAQVTIDGGTPTQVDLYAPTATFQPTVFSANMTDGTHTLTIQATGMKNAAATGARVVIDALDVITPGRRYEQYDPSVTYAGGLWTFDNDARVWTEGVTATSNIPGATATFTFTGTSVSWIGCEKGSASGVAEVYVDGTLQTTVKLNQSYPIEGYQMTVFRADGLTSGPHTLVVKVINTDSSYVVVDAFDVRQ